MQIREVFRTDGPGRVLFMSDLHYGHENILKMSDRPFKSIQKMNEFLASELSKLSPDDIVFDLGDMFWKCPIEEAEKVLESCPAKKYKVLGNHDKVGLYSTNNAELAKHFEIISDLLDIKVNYDSKDIRVTLCHYPMISWRNKSMGSFLCHGHNHGNLDSFNSESPELRVDVGVDGQLAKESGSFLISFEDIYNHFTKKVGSNDFQGWVWSNYNKNSF